MKMPGLYGSRKESGLESDGWSSASKVESFRKERRLSRLIPHAAFYGLRKKWFDGLREGHDFSRAVGERFSLTSLRFSAGV